VDRDVLDHVAQINAPTYLPTNDVQIPTGTFSCTFCLFLYSLFFVFIMFKFAYKFYLFSNHSLHYFLFICFYYQCTKFNLFVILFY